METHKPLNQEDREFRLLRIHECLPDNKGQPSTIELTFDHYSLNNPPEYVALSYVWGNSEERANISINGVPTTIRTNLHYALLQLRQDQMSSWLWVDAICINQNDHAERSSQVNEMRDIFSRAFMVYAWIGPQADGSDMAMNMLQSLSEVVLDADVTEQQWESFEGSLKNAYLHHSGAGLDEGLDAARSFCLKLGKPIGADPGQALKGLASLLHREYFSRVWIIQELALAKECKILCGAKGLDVTAFEDGLEAANFYMVWYHRVSDTPWIAINGTYFKLKPFRVRQKIRQGHARRLWDILQVYHAAPGRPIYMATDPRDVFYGVLACSSDATDLGIQADYSKTVPQVFAEVTKSFLNNCSDYPFGYCTSRKATPGLPSWVPDWQLQGLKGVFQHPVGYSNRFNASRNISQSSTSYEPTNWDILRRSGCRVDVVNAVMTPPDWHMCDYGVPRMKDQKAWLAEVIQFFELGEVPTQNEDAIWCAMILDRYPHSQRTTPEWRSLAPKIFRSQKLRMEDLTSSQVSCVKQMERMRPVSGLQQFCDDVMSWIEPGCRWRTFFKTKSGMIGLGPEQMMPNDIAVLIWGSRVPIVLRPLSENHYSYVGEAYIHGIMDGEFVDTKPETEIFDII
ncbi:heterokaryon incompatibility protein-domain-containing protein [Whalleya microplaca]|nr:heterokaryon incompatibility protein-domain-containing protein [Whalleya microplaca]